MFVLIVGARMKSSHDMALMIGWRSEFFARTKAMKSLADYLRTPDERRNNAARKILEMAKQKAKRKE